MLILIADDEAPARRELRYMLGQLWPEAELVDAADGVAALALIAVRPVDVAFLDINMPEMDGLEVGAALLELPDPPAIVFATAYNEHALRAFELAAFDYLVKPIDERRLAQTVARLQAQTAANTAPEAADALQRLMAELSPPRQFAKLWGEKDNEVRRLVDYIDIVWLEAREKRVYIATNQEQLRSHLSLKGLLARLPSPPFLQVHRSYVVNLDKVAEVVPWFSGSYLLRMNDAAQTEIPLARRHAAAFKKLTGW